MIFEWQRLGKETKESLASSSFLFGIYDTLVFQDTLPSRKIYNSKAQTTKVTQKVLSHMNNSLPTALLHLTAILFLSVYGWKWHNLHSFHFHFAVILTTKSLQKLCLVLVLAFQKWFWVMNLFLLRIKIVNKMCPFGTVA